MAEFSGFYESPGPPSLGDVLVIHWRTAMSIKMARDGGAFIHRRRLFRLL